MLSTIFIAVLLAAPAEPEAPPAVPQGCATETYELHLSDYLRFGDVVARAQRHCATMNLPDAPGFPGRSYIIGRTELMRFRLLGEEFGLNLNLVNQPRGALGTGQGFDAGQFGANRGSFGNDQLFVAPALDLPDSWDRAIDRAAGPAALVGGVALTTAVILGLLGK